MRVFGFSVSALLLGGVSVFADEAGRIPAKSFSFEKDANLDTGKWLAVNPNKAKAGEASVVGLEKPPKTVSRGWKNR